MKAQVKQAGKEFYIEERCYITELLNGPEDSELSIAKARVVPGETTAWHRLEETKERYVILSGHGRVDLGEDVESTEVKAGDTVLIPAMCPQRIANIGTEDLVFLAICTPPFDPDDYEDIEEWMLQEQTPVKWSELDGTYFEVSNMKKEYYEIEAFFDRQTAAFIVHFPEQEDVTGIPTDELPEDVHENDRYVALPTQYDLNLGKGVVFEFVEEFLNQGQADRVSRIFSKRGAYRSFRIYIDDIGMLDTWYEFEEKTKRARFEEWAKEHRLKIVD